MGQIEIRLAESAYSDLEDIENYISLDSPAIARKFISNIFDKIDQLKNYPLSGKPVPEIADRPFRQLLLNKYRIIYTVKTDTLIEIVRIVHGSRLLDIEP